jgi:hypothetical protein
MNYVLAMLVPERLVHLSSVDLAIIAIYFLAVLCIGFYLKRFAQSGEDFFLAGREMTAWVAGLRQIWDRWSCSAGQDLPINTEFLQRIGIGSVRFPQCCSSAS